MSDLEFDRTSTDAMHWAIEMAKIGRTLDDPMDENWLVAWFANYWAAVHDPLTRTIEAQAAEIERLNALVLQLQNALRARA